jgi:hypothetical protein
MNALLQSPICRHLQRFPRLRSSTYQKYARVASAPGSLHPTAP